MWPDLTDQVCLVTGGTRGVGFASGLELARHGAEVVLTYKWGDHDNDEIRTRFAAVGGKAPMMVQADAGSPEDVTRTIAEIAECYGRLDLLVSNVCVAARGGSLAALRKRDLLTSLRFSVWPLVTHLDEIERIIGSPPARTIAMSSDGPDSHYPQYDYVAIVKAALEAVARERNRTAPSSIFILRSRQVATESFDDMFADASRSLLDNAFSSFAIAPQSVGRAAVAFASGELDSLAGQALSIDRGAFFMDNTLTSAPMLLEAFGWEVEVG